MRCVEFREPRVSFAYAECSSPMSTVRRQRFHYEVPTPAAKYPLAALIERFAAAGLHHLYQKAPDGLYTVHQIVEFRELSLRQLLPAIRGPSDIAEAEE
jgi:hypothetical protein